MDQEKQLRKMGGLSGSKVSKKSKSFKHFHNILSQRLHRPQYLHNIRFGGLPRYIKESSLDLFKTRKASELPLSKTANSLSFAQKSVGKNAKQVNVQA